jgi:hypothetical protein
MVLALVILSSYYLLFTYFPTDIHLISETLYYTFMQKYIPIFMDFFQNSFFQEAAVKMQSKCRQKYHSSAIRYEYIFSFLRPKKYKYLSYTYRDLLTENLFNSFSLVYSSQPIGLRVSFLHV